jgi:hypothetical protein
MMNSSAILRGIDGKYYLLLADGYCQEMDAAALDIYANNRFYVLVYEGKFSYFNENGVPLGEANGMYYELLCSNDNMFIISISGGVDENGLVIRDSVLTKDLEYRSGKSALCYLGEVSAVREASFAEVAMLLQYMEKEK